MARKTEGVSELVRDVLRTIPKPYGEDIIEDVCLKIENNPRWRQRYDELCEELTQHVTNQWIGAYTKELTGMRTVLEVDAKRSQLITAYTKLVV